MEKNPPIINGYVLTQAFSNKNAGTCQWSFCVKNGREYFIKQFLSPKYPADGAEISEKQKEKKRRIADAFYKERSNFYVKLRQCRTGNNIVVEDFFRSGSCYYAVSEKIDCRSLSIAEISCLDNDKKMTLMRSVLHNMRTLHEKGIVHADIKPDNIIVKVTQGGYCTAKIIDFEGSYLESEPPKTPSGDQIYFAPETLEKTNDECNEKNIRLTTKVDIFALGILFHEYWSGKRPAINGSEYNYVHEAVLDNDPVLLSGKIPDEIRGIIRRMLSRNPENRPSAAQIFEELKEIKTEPASKLKMGTKYLDGGEKREKVSWTPGSGTAKELDALPDGFYISGDLD